MDVLTTQNLEHDYIVYVWSSFGIAAIILLAAVYFSVRSYKASLQRLTKMHAALSAGEHEG